MTYPRGQGINLFTPGVGRLLNRYHLTYFQLKKVPIQQVSYPGDLRVKESSFGNS